jgi:hypothetical protein
MQAQMQPLQEAFEDEEEFSQPTEYYIPPAALKEIAERGRFKRLSRCFF